MEKALACVIGNSAYPSHDLQTPANDANDIAEVLKSFGFNVLDFIDLTYTGFLDALTTFGNELPKYTTGLFYFAGHGFQINGENFLTAIDTSWIDDINAKYSSIPLNMILDYLHKAGTKTNIIILDACRDNPFEQAWSRSGSLSGLAPVITPKGTIISFATSPNQRAKNGVGRNGRYTGALLKHVVEPDLPIEILFKKVRSTVYSDTQGKQTTWEHTSLFEHFYFKREHPKLNEEILLEDEKTRSITSIPKILTGDVIKAPVLEYDENVIKDASYLIYDGSLIDDIIQKLKSYNFYTQNPAITHISEIDPTKQTKSKLFLLGRNILQAAGGGAFEAIRFLENANINLKRFTINGVNHLLNGMLFEIYFDSTGVFREKKLKSYLFNEIMALAYNKSFTNSFKFIETYLEPFKDLLFFTPSPTPTPINIDLSLLEKKSDGNIEYEIKSLSLKGKSILKKVSDDPFYDLLENYYEPYLFDKFKDVLSTALTAPSSQFEISSNYELNGDSKILLPYGYLISN